MTFGYGYGDEAIEIMKKQGEVAPMAHGEGANSEIVNFLRGKTIFLTGATGFIGKLLVEKVLRTCPQVERVFILVRAKKGQSISERVDKLYADAVFGPLTKLHPKFQHKIHPIQGDISSPHLGISPADQQLITQHTHIIFHVAATVRFDENLKTATYTNVRSTVDMLKLARKCPKLVCLNHVSTAFSHCTQDEIQEQCYAMPIAPTDLIAMCDRTDAAEFNETKTREIVGNWPNTYCFTKALAEDVLRTQGQGLPICIYRPSIVTSTYREPLKSWIDNVYGVTGVMLGIGIGVLKTVHIIGELNVEMVPADLMINGLIAAACKTAKVQSLKEPQVYNYVSSVENPISYNRLKKDNERYGIEIPSKYTVSYYSVMFNRYYIVHLVCSLLLQLFPALVADAVLFLVGKKTMMIKTYNKITKFEKVLQFFTLHQWKFHNDNVQKLWQELNDTDRKLFPFSMREFQWDDYIKTQLLGMRIYLVKDGIDSIESSRRNYRWFYLGHCLAKGLIYYFGLRMLVWFCWLCFAIKLF